MTWRAVMLWRAGVISCYRDCDVHDTPTGLITELTRTVRPGCTTIRTGLQFYCQNVVPKYVLTSIYFRPALCFIFVYNCGLAVRNKRICYVMLCYVTTRWLVLHTSASRPYSALIGSSETRAVGAQPFIAVQLVTVRLVHVLLYWLGVSRHDNNLMLHRQLSKLPAKPVAWS